MLQMKWWRFILINMMPLRHLIIAILIPLSWGVNAPIVKMAIQTMPPLCFATLRSLLLGFLVLKYRRPPVSMRVVNIFACCHGVKITLLYYSLYIGLAAGISTVLLQTQSLFAVILAVIIFKEYISIRNIMGLILAFFGVIVISFEAHVSAHITGMAFVLCSAAMAAISFLVIRKKQDINYVAFVGWFNLISVIPFAIAAYFFEGASISMEVLENIDTSFVFLLIGSAITVVVAYGFLMYLLSIYPTSKVVPFTLLIPVFGVSTSYVCLNEWCEWQAILGSTIVMLGLVINQYDWKILR